MSLQDYFIDKTVLVTGASQGLGHELAVQLQNLGASVIALSRNYEKLQALKNEISQKDKVEIMACDVANREQIRQSLRGRDIDIAILNAGVKETGNEFFSPEKIRTTFEVNLFGVTNCLEGLLPGMMRRQTGHLVFISSQASYHPMVSCHGYNASKAALSNLVDSLAMDLKKKGNNILVTLVKPGLIDTAMMPQTGLARFLAMKKERAAEKILNAIARKKYHVVFPKSFYLLTLLMAALPKKWQGVLLARVKN